MELKINDDHKNVQDKYQGYFFYGTITLLSVFLCF